MVLPTGQLASAVGHDQEILAAHRRCGFTIEKPSYFFRQPFPEVPPLSEALGPGVGT
jgi:hypothetical protein